jgi:hypothetical protein
MANIMPTLLYPGGKNPQYPLNRRLGEPQTKYGALKEKNLLPIPAFEPRFIKPVA